MCTATPTSQLSGGEFSGRMRDITNVSEVKSVDNSSIEQLIEKFRSGLEVGWLSWLLGMTHVFHIIIIKLNY